MAATTLLNTALDLAFKYTRGQALKLLMDDKSLNPLLVTQVVLSRPDQVARFEYDTVGDQKFIIVYFKEFAHEEGKAQIKPKANVQVNVKSIVRQTSQDMNLQDALEVDEDGDHSDSEEGFIPVKPKPRKDQPQRQFLPPSFDNGFSPIKTQLCKYYEQGYCMHRTNSCQYAHGKNDLRK